MQQIKFIMPIFLIAAMVLRADDVIVIEEPSLSNITIGNVELRGTGCPLGSTAVSIDPLTQELSVAFDSYISEAGLGHAMDRKNCALAIPVKVAAGVKLAIVATDYSGYNLLPEGASTVFTTETFIAGRQGTEVREVFSGELYDSFEVTDAKLIKDLASGCGTDLTLRINSSLRVRTNESGDWALASVEGLSSKSGALRYRLKLSRCD